MTTSITLRNGKSIDFTNYKSALTHRNKIASFCKINSIFYEAGNSTQTGSYYIEIGTNDFTIDVRLSNHTKPDQEKNNVIAATQHENGHTYIEISILCPADFKAAFTYLKSIL